MKRRYSKGGIIKQTPKQDGYVEITAKAPTYNELSEKWGNVDIQDPKKKKALREAWDRDHPKPKEVRTQMPERYFAEGGMMKRHSGATLHAYGSKIRSKWNGGDWGTMGVQAGMGALGGATAGATIGSAGGPIGAGAGAIIGGTIGLVGGILSANSQAKERATLEEQNRQTTIANMDDRIESDSLTANNEEERSMSFYLRGGRILSRRRLALGGSMEPISTDTSFVDGPSHAQGGVMVDSENEVEGNEVMKDNLGENGEVASTDVYSNRLVNPHTGRPFAKDALELSQIKGILQKKFAANEKRIAHERNLTSDGKANRLLIGSAKRRAEIAATDNEQVLYQIEQVDAGLKQLFNVQQEVNGDNQGESENGVKMAAWGTRLYPKGIDYMKLANTKSINTGAFKSTQFNNMTNIKSEMIGEDAYDGSLNGNFANVASDTNMYSQLGYQAGAQVLDTVGQAITANQMSKLPTPTRRRTRPGMYNTYVDNSADIKDITANAGATKEFINNNIKGAQARRNAIMNIMSKENDAKSRSFMTRFAAERDLENKNVEIMYRNDAMNNEIGYMNDADKYNATLQGLSRQSQIIGNTADKLSQLTTAKAQLDSNDMGSAMILAQFPEGVRRRIAAQMRKGRSMSTAIKIES